MKRFLFIILTLITVAIGCKVDTAGFPQPSSVNSLLIGKWYVKAETASDATSVSATSTDFNAKDFFIFNSDNTVVASLSSPDTSATARYSYTNDQSGQKIVMGNPGDIGIYSISKLTTDSLIMTTVGTIDNYTIANGITTSSSSSYNLTYKLAHK